MIKFVICEDSDEALETAGKYVIKAMMNYDIEYKVLKTPILTFDKVGLVIFSSGAVIFLPL